MLILRRLLEIMQDKSASLEARGSGNRQAFSTRELATYWFTHCVNSSLLPLRHLCFAKHSHPEEVWLELSRLAGALFTFALESHPRSLPLYDHARLDECFDAMDQVIRMHLDLVVPTNALRIRLERISQFFWAGEIQDKRAFDRSDWLLSVSSGRNLAETIERVPRLVKVCSQEFVPKLVERALPGMALTHLPAPPPAVAPSVERQYFGISKAGPCWDHLRKSSQVGIYMPEDLLESEPEIIVVLNPE
jgi:type VI secretion system protein ImpJ